MIEATCAACGTLNRIAEGDVPTGAKFIACSSCKSRVAVLARPTTAGSPAPAIPAMPAQKGPPPIPVLGPGTRPTIDLADLPAPKRANPLAGAGQAKPPPRSALSELGAKPPPGSPFADLESDLPAPKGATPAAFSLDMDDLAPMNVTPTAFVDAAPIDMDLGRSGAAETISDLPAPKAKPIGIPSIPKPELPNKPTATIMGSPVTDLPTPKRPGSEAAREISDLPAPKAPAKPARPPLTALAPGSKAPTDIVDLPAPKPDAAGTKSKPRAPSEVAAPRTMTSGTDLPAPKGFFDDLQPALDKDKPELPAPKGFFDDLPQPALNKDRSDLPAPKGFFEDLPQPGLTNKPDLPAPKGFFEDLPQPGLTNKPDLPAPKGFYDNLPQRGLKKPGEEPGSDLADLELRAPEIELPDRAANQEIELQGPSPELDLGLPEPMPAKGSTQFDDLDLSKPSASGGIRFEKSSDAASKPPRTPLVGLTGRAALPAQPGSELSLELAEEQPSEKSVNRKVAAKVEQVARQPAPATPKNRSKIALGAVLGLALVGGGGFYMYQRHQAAQARADEITAQLATARMALHAPEPTHWQRAASAAKAVLEQDDTNADALAIGAEAQLAGALETGINAPARIGQGRAMLNTANKASLNTPELEVPRALDAIASNQPDRAITKLTPLLAKTPNDAYLLLYMGWAQLAKGDGPAAIKSFDAAIAASPNVKTSALYSRGKARLTMADLAGARGDFGTVLEAAKDHVAAMVGLAAAGPPSQTSQREADLLAVLARKDIATADQRAVVQAWTLAGDVARGNGRVDVARERYHKALALTAADVPALTGLAATELRDGKLDAATELVTKALTLTPDDVDAQLVASELAIRQGKLKDAETRLTAIGGRQPAVPPLQEARMHLAKGKLFEARGNDEAAIDEYVLGAKVAGEIDLAPTMAAVTKLGELAKKDPAKAASYRERADQLLSSLAERAQEDPQLAMTIGVAYLDAGDPTKAETFLRRAVEMRGNDVEAKLGLSRALVKLDRVDDAIGQLQNALQIDASRIDISLELARTFEAAKREADAIGAYEKLLAAKEIPLQARIHAGRFFARIGDLKRAVAQAEDILKEQPDNAAGHYLKGERFLMEGKVDEARHELLVATTADPDPYYFDAAGRADEKSLNTSHDTKYIDQAIHKYDQSHQALETLFNPLAGMGRLYVLRREYDKALKNLLDANKLKENDPEVMFNIGVCYQALGSPSQKGAAIEWLKKAGQANPRSAETQWRLAELFYDPDINRANDAAAAYARAITLAEAAEKAGTPVEWLTDAYGKIGALYFGSALHNECAAKTYYDKYLAHNPDPGTARTNEIRQQMRTTLKSCR